MLSYSESKGVCLIQRPTSLEQTEGEVIGWSMEPTGTEVENQILQLHFKQG